MRYHHLYVPLYQWTVSCSVLDYDNAPGIFPVAFFFHRNPWRREPMLAAVIVLQLALVLFMQVEVFTAMVVARFLQGGASSVVFSGEPSWYILISCGACADEASRNGSDVSTLQSRWSAEIGILGRTDWDSCENVPRKNIGRQIGWGLSGAPIGSLLVSHHFRTWPALI